MLVDLEDGKCPSCGGQLKIVGADDATLDAETGNRIEAIGEEEGLNASAAHQHNGDALCP